MILDIFKVGIYKAKLEIDNKLLEDYIRYTKKLDTIGVTKSNRGGYHSPNLDLSSDDLKLLIEQILDHSNVYAKNIGYKEAKMDNLWFNINYYKDFNAIHSHPQTKLSGVYYVKTPDNCGNIRFYSPAHEVINHSSLATPDNHYTSSTWWLPAEQNVLYIFPSWLLHLVEPNMNSEKERISFSFNLN